MIFFNLKIQEVEIHKVRTGHQEFTDKTVESAKPLNLEESNNTSAKEGNSEDKEGLKCPCLLIRNTLVENVPTVFLRTCCSRG